MPNENGEPTFKDLLLFLGDGYAVNGYSEMFGYNPIEFLNNLENGKLRQPETPVWDLPYVIEE